MDWKACQAPLSMRILQARILEWVAVPSSRGFSQPRDRTQVSRLQTDSLPSEPPRKPIYVLSNSHLFSPVLLTTITMHASIHIRSWEQLFPPILQRLYPLTAFTYFPHPPGPHIMSLFLWVKFLFYFYFFDFTYNWDHTVFIFYYVTYFT